MCIEVHMTASSSTEMDIWMNGKLDIKGDPCSSHIEGNTLRYHNQSESSQSLGESDKKMNKTNIMEEEFKFKPWSVVNTEIQSN